jgi:hypothetical protein
MVEELLKSLVGEVDAQLLEAIELYCVNILEANELQSSW